MQWLDDGVWKPSGPKAPRPRGKTIEMIEQFIEQGKSLKYEKYRVVPASGDVAGDDNDEEVAMATKEKKEKAVKAAKETVELVAGRFRPGSLLAKMYDLLKDGVARTPDAIAKVVKPQSVQNLTKGRFRQLRKWGNRSEMYSAVITDEGKIQLLPFSKAPKKEAKAEKAPEPKAEKKAEAKPEKKEKKAEAKPEKKAKENGKAPKKEKEKAAAPAKKSGPTIEA